MSIDKSLDRAIMRQEIGGESAIKAGYRIGDRVYENYMSNESWMAFKNDMASNHPTAYTLFSLGGGKELEERRVGQYIYPPKMASFGSSSRMMYMLMRSNPRFLFEKKLPTTIGGTANLDGFIQTDTRCVFIEAKCREPYSAKDTQIAEKYRALYKFLTDSTNNNIFCRMTPVVKGKMRVRFFADQKELHYFDIKQMICHLLGVATAYLERKYNKMIDFIYLLYNPTALLFEDERHKKQILQIYKAECTECMSVNFEALFYDILKFLQEKEKVGVDCDIEWIASLFLFRMCDQNTLSLTEERRLTMREVIYQYNTRGVYETADSTVFGEDKELHLVIEPHDFSLAIGEEVLRSSSCDGYRVAVTCEGAATFYDANGAVIARAENGESVYRQVKLRWAQGALSVEFGQTETVDYYPHCDGESDRWGSEWVARRVVKLDLQNRAMTAE